MFVLIIHNLRSAYNVGALFRTADGVGIDKIYLTGYSPIPAKREAFYKTAAQKMLAKTALGAQDFLAWEQQKFLTPLLKKIKSNGYEIIGLEQDSSSIQYDTYIPKRDKIALIVGNEPRGIHKQTLRKCDAVLEIPMLGKKNSLNVAIAFGIAGYALQKSIKDAKMLY
jgi:23S rRNA (guanosine2251-2'-O)-methyltransferase